VIAFEKIAKSEGKVKRHSGNSLRTFPPSRTTRAAIAVLWGEDWRISHPPGAKAPLQAKPARTITNAGRVLEYAVRGFYRSSELRPVDFPGTKQERSTGSKVVQEGVNTFRHTVGC
jgi:hypothetical protein